MFDCSVIALEYSCDEDLQRHVACCRLWPTDSCLSTRPYSGVRHRRPWPTTASVGTAVRSSRSCAPVVSLLPFRQVFPCALQQSDVLCCLHCVLCATKVSTGSESFYFLHSGPCWRSGTTPSEHAWHADDTQLYLHCRRDDTTAAVTRLETCLNHVSHRATVGIALKLSSGAVVCQYSLAVSLPLLATMSVF